MIRQGFVIAILALGTTAVAEPFTAMAQDVARATFNDDGTIRIPQNWREWVFIGSPLTPNGLNDGKAPFPEFHNVYIEPSAFADYRRTGTFPNGTQIAKELVLTRASEGGNFPDGSSNEVSGRGFFQGEFHGLELAYKDAARFPEEPGGWVYYSFGHKSPPYDQSAKAFPADACNACHQASAAEDYVFTQFYPVLRSAKP